MKAVSNSSVLIALSSIGQSVGKFRLSNLIYQEAIKKVDE